MARSLASSRASLLVWCVGLLFVARPADGQLISPKTVPVHWGEQFGIFPADLPGMGGVSIAVQDTLGDLWSNPAKATRLRRSSLVVMPISHRATAGGGRSLPISLFQAHDRLSGAVLLTMQELDRTNAAWNAPISERHASNAYYAAALGGRLDGGLSLGASLSIADLGGVDGVDALYAGSDRVVQSGSQLDARLGLTKDFASGATLEAVAVHYRYDMSHDVRYPQGQAWPADCSPWLPPGAPQWCEPTIVPAREEFNLDRTNTSGLHLAYLLPKTDSGFRAGLIFTANRLAHPKIPNYRIQNIPRDPGNTDALNIGGGISHALERTTFGLDFVLEPMWSHTWADAASDTTDVTGRLLRRGAHTVDNHFRFRNVHLRAGFAHEYPGSIDSGSVFGIQFGLGLRRINYTLDQANHVLLESRSQQETWTEWTRTFAARLRGGVVDFTYSYSNTCGPDCTFMFPVFPRGDDVAAAPPAAPGVIAAPSGPLSFDGGSSSQHRFMVSIRMR